jgi:predicted DNA-binding transcriptional regulator AlpA
MSRVDRYAPPGRSGPPQGTARISAPTPTPQPLPVRVLRAPSAAEYVGLSTAMINKLRVKGGGPRFIRLGARAVGYDVRDLDDWIASRRRFSTSE